MNELKQAIYKINQALNWQISTSVGNTEYCVQYGARDRLDEALVLLAEVEKEQIERCGKCFSDSNEINAALLKQIADLTAKQDELYESRVIDLRTEIRNLTAELDMLKMGFKPVDFDKQIADQQDKYVKAEAEYTRQGNVLLNIEMSLVKSQKEIADLAAENRELKNRNATVEADLDYHKVILDGSWPSAVEILEKALKVAIKKKAKEKK